MNYFLGKPNHSVLFILIKHILGFYWRVEKVRLNAVLIESLCLQYLLMNIQEKRLILIFGAPGSGKSYLAKKFQKQAKKIEESVGILSVDKIQAFTTQHEILMVEQLEQCWANSKCLVLFQNYELDRQKFDNRSWKIARQFVKKPQFLSELFEKFEILIIEQQMPLYSQRKPFRKFCSKENILFLEIGIILDLKELNQNIKQRQSKKEGELRQITLKSLQKMQVSKTTFQLFSKKQINELTLESTLKKCQKVHIADNYTEILLKAQQNYDYTEKQLDQNVLRKLISNLIKGQSQQAQGIFPKETSKRQKSQILSQAKKQYIHRNRKIPFMQILSQILQKYELEK